MNVPPLHRCSRCSSDKPLDEFPPSKVRNRSQWCRQCLRIDKREKLGLKAAERTARCPQCSGSFTTSHSKAIFCSRQCKGTARNALAAAERLASKPARACVHCGADIPQAMRADAKFCSDGCNSAAHAVTRKMAKRAGRSSRHDDPLVERNYIAKRDGFRCGICGGRVDMTRKHPDPLFGSIDHIVPLADGGTNDLSNLQLAHLRCNLRKRDRGGQQLRLLG